MIDEGGISGYDPLRPVATFKVEWQIAHLKESSVSINDEATT